MTRESKITAGLASIPASRMQEIIDSGLNRLTKSFPFDWQLIPLTEARREEASSLLHVISADFYMSVGYKTLHAELKIFLTSDLGSFFRHAWMAMLDLPELGRFLSSDKSKNPQLAIMDAFTQCDLHLENHAWSTQKEADVAFNARVSLAEIADWDKDISRQIVKEKPAKKEPPPTVNKTTARKAPAKKKKVSLSLISGGAGVGTEDFEPIRQLLSSSTHAGWALALWQAASKCGANAASGKEPNWPLAVDEASEEALQEAQRAILLDDSTQAALIRSRIARNQEVVSGWVWLTPEQRGERLTHVELNMPELDAIAREADVPANCRLGLAILRLVEAAHAAVHVT